MVAEVSTFIPTDWSKVADGITEEDSGSRYAMDSKLYVQFYSRPMIQVGESNKAQRPIYADVCHIRIFVPGDKLSIVDRVASSDDTQRFAAHYAKYKAGEGNEVIGTRLEVVPWMSRAKVEKYKYFQIHTVEQLAAAGDSVAHKFQGFMADKLKAQQYLDQTTGTDARVAALEAQLAALQAQMPSPKPVEQKATAKA